MREIHFQADAPRGVSHRGRSPESMEHRIRGAALVLRDDRLLLVHHFEGRTGADYWLPPGGGAEISDSSIFECAVRETREETGVEITASRIIYVKEFIDHAYAFRNFELFVLADAVNGEASVRESWPAGREYPSISEVRWFTKEEMAGLTVYPEQIKSLFWDDLSQGFPATRHLGTSIREKRANPESLDVAKPTS